MRVGFGLLYFNQCYLKGTFENFLESPSELRDFQRYRNRLSDSFFMEMDL